MKYCKKSTTTIFVIFFKNFHYIFQHQALPQINIHVCTRWLVAQFGRLSHGNINIKNTISCDFSGYNRINSEYVI